MIFRPYHIKERLKIWAFAVAGMNRHELAIKAGLTESATRHIHDPAWNPTFNTLVKLDALVPDDFTFEQMPESFKKPTERKTKDDRKNPKK